MDNKLQARVKARDAKHLDPTERAELVNSFLFAALGIEDPEEAVAHPLYWDLLCWCSQMLALFALGVGETDLLNIAKAMNQQIMSLHYALPEGEPELGHERDLHEQLWHERIRSLLGEEGK